MTEQQEWRLQREVATLAMLDLIGVWDDVHRWCRNHYDLSTTEFEQRITRRIGRAGLPYQLDVIDWAEIQDHYTP